MGVHQFGCGIESQLESWYRFLVQPDPYASLGLDKTGKFAQWVGVDTVLLAQRADFLRPDSLVAVIVLSDENDSEVDVRSFGGTAWNFMSSQVQPAARHLGVRDHSGRPAVHVVRVRKEPQRLRVHDDEGGFYTTATRTTGAST